MVAIGAAHAGKALIKVATFQALSNYMGNYRTEEAIFSREEIVIAILADDVVLLVSPPASYFLVGQALLCAARYCSAG